MKIVRITDGLGNQMFQYAFALAVRKKTGEKVVLDRNWFPEFGGKLRNAVPRTFGLSAYNLSIKDYVGKEESDRVIYGSGLRGKVNQLLHLRPGLLREDRFNLSLNNLDCYIGNDYVFRGFFQKSEYPAYVRDELLEQFSLDEALLNDENRRLIDKIEACGDSAVFVHVRRGDYVLESSRKVFGLCSLEYYANAVRVIADKAGIVPHLFVFSDDMEWVKENYHPDFPVTFVDFNPADQPHLDINLMRHCRHGVTANSTFSWWGAWLIENPNAVIVSPARWYAGNYSAEGLRPTSWHLV